METADDAGVYRVTDDLAIINTVDFFTPIVDDPYTFGAIAVANALSDVYSMGGVPLTALNLVMWDKTLPEEVLGEILRGGVETLQRARCVLVGGHSVDAPELMYGVAVTGTVHPKRFVRNCDAQAGDVLILTKPLGVGILTTAAKYDDITVDDLRPAVDSMLTLNDASAEVMVAFGAHASTDVTGFGLLGHAYGMAKRSDVALEITAGQVPVFDGVFDLIRRETRTRAPRLNRAYVGDRLRFDDGVSDEWRQLLLEAETSGGLVLAFPPDRAASALDELRRRGARSAAVIGRVVAGEGGGIRVIP
jgi:selenide,water dikinase